MSEQNPRPRLRDVGISPGRLNPGKHNAITDVPGVRVGHSTLIRGNGKLVPGEGPVRTGVTAVIPHEANCFQEKLIAYAHAFNGFGKSAGLSQVQELGLLETPILLTNTLNVGRAADALVAQILQQNPDVGSINPVVGECNDGRLNDIQGRHVGQEEVFAALDSASGGPVEEGAVGGGTGMRAFQLKGGIGTASRELPEELGGYTIGTLVQANFGRRPQLTILGVPVGEELSDWNLPEETSENGSIMIVLATDAPLTARQLGRVARRTGLGLGRTGSIMGHGSGDYVIAFSTAQRFELEWDEDENPEELPIELEIRMVAEHSTIFDELFAAAVETAEEAVLNALFRAETMVGRDGNVAHALPIDRVIHCLKQHGRL
jgi:D-aminopeptidase